MTTTPRILALLPVAGLLLLSACGGGSGSSSPVVQPKQLAYTNPTSGDYKLLKNAASTPTTLILDLQGPAGTTGTGAGFTLSLDSTKATWSSTLINGKAFVLGSAPQILSATVSGGTLQAAVAQKGLSAPVDLGNTLATVQMSMVSGATPGDLALQAGKCKVLTPTGIQTITVSVGTLKVQ